MGERYTYSSHLLISSVNYLTDNIRKGLINSGNLEADIQDSIQSIRECRMQAFLTADKFEGTWVPKLSNHQTPAKLKIENIIEPQNNKPMRIKILSQSSHRKGIAHTKAMIRLTRGGIISFNKLAIEKLALKPDSQIDFGQDEDKSEKYVVFLTDKGLKSHKAQNPYEMRFQSRPISGEIFHHLKISENIKAISLEISDKFTHEQDGQKYELFPLILKK